MNASSSESSIGSDRKNRTDSSHILGQLERDLRDNLQEVTLETWMEAVLGLSPRRLNQWTTRIKNLDWFQDRVIRRALTDYARPTVTEKSDIYKPFARITNRILELAKDTLPGVGDNYPIEDIKVVVNGSTQVECIPEHGRLGVSRQPDLLFVRGAQNNLSSDIESPARWVDVLAFLEFRLINKGLLIQTLNNCRKGRGLPIINTESRKSRNRSKRSAVKYATRRYTGSKRSIDDMLEGESDQSRGSSKKRKSDSLSPERMGKGVRLLAAGNALELASCTYGTRVFSLGSIVRDDKMSFWYYDASGYVRTAESLSVMEDFEKFAAIMVAFACGEPKHWGALPDIISPPTSTPYPSSFPPPSLKGHSIQMILPDTKERVKVTLGKPIFTQYGLVGRRTFLYQIKTNTVVAQKPLVIKFSYQVVTRKREQDLVEVACKAGVKHIPKVHMWRDLWKLSEGARAIFHGDNKDAYEDRMLRALVYTRYLPLKALFRTAWHLIPHMADQILDCLHDLRYKANILHQDISNNNIMFEIQDGAVNFVLIDFDMATTVDSSGQSLAARSAKHRTGTLPFMAYELLDDMAYPASSKHKQTVHRLRHDFESLFYLCLYCIFTMVEVEDPKIKADMAKQLSHWEDLSYDGIASIKYCLCTDVKHIMNRLVFPVPCEVLRLWFYGWVVVFSDAYLALRGHQTELVLAKLLEDKCPPPGLFDIDTLQGKLTRDTIKRSLEIFNDHPLRAEDLQVANISDLDKVIESYMDTSGGSHASLEDGQDEPVLDQRSAAQKTRGDRKPKCARKAREAGVINKKKAVAKTVVTAKVTEVKTLSPFRNQSPKLLVPTHGPRTLAVTPRSMTTRSMQKAALAKTK